MKYITLKREDESIMSGIHVKFEITAEELLAELTDAAYRVALTHGKEASFLEMELALQKELRKVIQKTMDFSSACGTFEECKKSRRSPSLPS